ncbi:MAG: sigma-70 family RNA polymerase sigma factor, partial [Myxococcota bacterium]|nr:sigma-70 family RNA polymerase sigma factor [Myxococcota bacterium]
MQRSDIDSAPLLDVRSAASRAPMLSADEERRLLSAIGAGEPRALERLVATHLRLVVSIARRYTGGGASLEDLVGEGLLGLVEAVRRFEIDRGTRFGTYAAWWVRAYVRRYALANRRIVGAPTTRAGRRLMARLRRTEWEIAQRTGRPALRSEVARALDVSEEDVALVQALLGTRDVALGPHDDGTGLELADEARRAQGARRHAEALEVEPRWKQAAAALGAATVGASDDDALMALYERVARGSGDPETVRDWLLRRAERHDATLEQLREAAMA